MVFADKETLNKKDTGMFSLMLSIGASIENALLRATELGIGSLWMYDICAISEQLEQKYCSEGMLVSGLCFGEASPSTFRAKKKELKDIILNNDVL